VSARDRRHVKDALVAVVSEEGNIPEEGRPLAPQEEEESEESVCAVFWEDELWGGREGPTIRQYECRV
jgi:hypothetical protein